MYIVRFVTKCTRGFFFSNTFVENVILYIVDVIKFVLVVCIMFTRAELINYESEQVAGCNLRK